MSKKRGYSKKKIEELKDRANKRVRGVARRLNRELKKSMEEAGYEQKEIERAYGYSLIGRKERIFRDKVQITKTSKSGRRTFIRGVGWKSTANINRSMKMKSYWGKVKLYQELFDTDLKESRDIYRNIRDVPRVEEALKDTIY